MTITSTSEKSYTFVIQPSEKDGQSCNNNELVDSMISTIITAIQNTFPNYAIQK